VTAEDKPSRFGLVGTGWRADFFLRLAAALPARFEVAAVATRDPAKGEAIEQAWSVPTVRTASDLIGTYKPEFVVASVNRVATPEIIETCVRHGIPVLAETPPALDRPAMRDLWRRLTRPELVQVAEQYPYLPKLQAVQALIDAGQLGGVTAAEVSWTHNYHAVAMLRGLLGAGFREATVTAQAFTAPITASLTREGWPDRTELTEVTRTIALLNFGDLLGVYDFTENQWFHPLMGRRLTVRGTTGEITGDRVTTLVDHRTPVTATLQRRQTGIDGDLEGFDLDTIALGTDVLYRNPFQGTRLSDEDIAIASVLDRMRDWVRGTAAPPYPLAQACQDHLLALAIIESARKEQPVTVSREAWANP
jgi:predicted dehydrogenase